MEMPVGLLATVMSSYVFHVFMLRVACVACLLLSSNAIIMTASDNPCIQQDMLNSPTYRYSTL